jgi:hypothetical protein
MKAPLMNDRGRAAGDGVGDEVMSVRLEAGDRREKAPRDAPPGIVAERNNILPERPADPVDLQSFDQPRQLHAIPS